jgi:hypothetical protein
VGAGGPRWFSLLWLLPIGWLALIAAVAAAQGLRNMPAVRHFMALLPRGRLGNGHVSGVGDESAERGVRHRMIIDPQALRLSGDDRPLSA